MNDRKRGKWHWLWFLVPVAYFIVGLLADWHVSGRR